MGVLVAIVLLAIAFGKDALDLYRLTRYVDASVAANEVNDGPWPATVSACAICHGIDGDSQNQAYPDLAGQPTEYLAKQLRDFASGQRRNPQMESLARATSEREIEQLAAHFARQTVVDNPDFAANPELRNQGKTLVANLGCAGCHGANLMGIALFPRLAGQGQEYLRRQLDAYADGSRKDASGTMNALAANLSMRQRGALATFLATLPVSAAPGGQPPKTPASTARP